MFFKIGAKVLHKKLTSGNTEALTANQSTDP